MVRLSNGQTDHIFCLDGLSIIDNNSIRVGLLTDTWFPLLLVIGSLFTFWSGRMRHIQTSYSDKRDMESRPTIRVGFFLPTICYELFLGINQEIENLRAFDQVRGLYHGSSFPCLYRREDLYHVV